MEKNITFHMIYRLSLCEMYFSCYSLICNSWHETPYQSLRVKKPVMEGMFAYKMFMISMGIL